MDDPHKKIADFYNSRYYADFEKNQSPSRHLISLCARLNIRKSERVLDIACGTGEWLQVCADRGANISGIDISSKAIERCRHRLPTGNFDCGPAETLPYPDSAFDVVTCLGSLEHFLDQEHALREMARVAKPNARITILVPNSGFLTYRLGLYSGTQQQAARETIRSLSAWEAMMINAGLEIQSRWKDLHIITPSWIFRRPHIAIPARLAQALALPFWPLSWQYQVYHHCSVKAKHHKP